jgi:hypothetical protein
VQRPNTLQAFNPNEREKAHFFLATQVTFMMGRKLEEGDWSSVYCRAKMIPEREWSNLNIDVMHEGLGVEHKMLRVPPDSPMRSYCGTTLMHPSATRSIRIPSTEADPNEVMLDVLTQYADLLDQRRAKIKEDCPGKEPDLRTGWLLWQRDLTEFLYFEEEAINPNPDDYFAEWRESGGGGRKASKNLWVYEKETGRKRYSVTTAAGAKIQPYFDVPPPNDSNVYIFKVQGEEVAPGVVRIWVRASTARELRSIVGDLSPGGLALVISSVAEDAQEAEEGSAAGGEEALPFELTTESYSLLVATFSSAVSDEHMMQLLVARLRK